jgi:hypothetical protein
MYAWRKAAATALGGCLLLTVGLPTRAEASTAAPVTDAQLLAKGAAVAVTATFPCPVDKSGSFNVKLGQKVSAGQFAAGSGGVYGPCAGDSTTVTVTVIPTGSLAFKVGAAEVTGSLFACDPSFSCFSFEFAQEVRIHN